MLYGILIHIFATTNLIVSVMKHTITLLFLVLITAFSLRAQTEFKPSGTGIGQIFFNYGYDLTKDVDARSAFNLERAYLGYKYDFAQNFSARVIFDVSYDKTNGQFTAFAKNAFIDWQMHKNLRLTAGLIPVKHFELQEKYWGYRYIMKPHIDQYGMGTTADLGVNLEIPLNMVNFNLYVLNGESFKAKVMPDPFGLHKVGANVTVEPVTGLVFRAHYDYMPAQVTLYDTVNNEPVTSIVDLEPITTFSVFAGYEVKDKYRVGIGYNSMSDARNYLIPSEGRNLGGISVHGTYFISPKYEVFARYDWLKSNKLTGDEHEWNYNKDGSFIIAGLQYKVTRNVNFALNYRTFLFNNSDLNNTSGIFLNMGISW